ncbi:adenylate cyclase type 5-like isoform X1 [Penaeus chinensis]|uniref:adenylate cyclase type 5-like isoform X1 n=1 Tax=Penaeus chinensis TaxID=139456 RepID=UPI001FB6A99D|nr:adenylate cyclase type 5-like isoform X1 [Penaeus chinensis]XP_047480136.1 adenylate cyclase type 5-like isoform X1 [Penaeus chinensis]
MMVAGEKVAVFRSNSDTRRNSRRQRFRNFSLRCRRMAWDEEGVSIGAPRSSSLRHSKTNGSTHTSLESRPSTGEPPPKKSNWEVIEHYSKSGLVGVTTPKSPPEEEQAKEEEESILLETAKWWDMCALCRRIFRSHQFKNIHVEVLYQRYFLRMNQSNMTSLLGLLIVVMLAMLCLIYFLEPGKYYTQSITIAVFCALYVVLEILLWRTQLLNEVYLIIFSYLVLISFFGLEALMTLGSEPLTASAGVWATLFFIYMTYTLLPLRVLEATAGGVLLSVAQIGCAAAGNAAQPFLWKQLVCNGMLFACVNVAGLFTHYPGEAARRQAFIETRQCISARMNTQRENQQQVKRTSVLVDFVVVAVAVCVSFAQGRGRTWCVSVWQEGLFSQLVRKGFLL